MLKIMAKALKSEQTSLARVLAVDPSLTCSGWALLGITGGELLAVGELRSLPADLPMAVRLQDLQLRIDKLFSKLDLGQGDGVICEGPTTMRDPAAAIKVEQVRGIFETVARFRQAEVPGRINPKSVHSELLGFKGKQQSRPVVKQAALQVVQQLYGERLMAMGFMERGGRVQSQDVVDAILIGSIAVERVRRASAAGLPLAEVLRSSSEGARRSRVRSSWRTK